MNNAGEAPHAECRTISNASTGCYHWDSKSAWGMNGECMHSMLGIVAASLLSCGEGIQARRVLCLPSRRSNLQGIEASAPPPLHLRIDCVHCSLMQCNCTPLSPTQRPRANQRRGVSLSCIECHFDAVCCLLMLHPNCGELELLA